MEEELDNLYPDWKDLSLVESIYEAAHNERWFHVEYMIDRGIIQKDTNHLMEGGYIVRRVLKILYQYNKDEMADLILDEFGYGSESYKYPILVYHRWRSNRKHKERMLETMIDIHQDNIIPLIGYMTSEMRNHALLYIGQNEEYRNKNIYYYLNSIEGKISYDGYDPKVEPQIFSFDRRSYYSLSHTHDSDIPILHPEFSVSEAMDIAKKIRL